MTVVTNYSGLYEKVILSTSVKHTVSLAVSHVLHHKLFVFKFLCCSGYPQKYLYMSVFVANFFWTKIGESCVPQNTYPVRTESCH